MSSRLTSFQIVILAILGISVCCVFACIGIFVISEFSVGSNASAGSEATVLPIALATYPPTYTITPNVTKTPAPTNTRVIDFQPAANVTPGSNPKTTAIPQPVLLPQRTPTLAANPYQVIIPTPTAPVMTYPIAFTSTFKIVTYNVTGKNSSEISKSLQANAISDPHEPGSDYYALTKWEIRTSWNPKLTPRGCELDSGYVSVAVTITMPSLTPTSGVASDVLKQFNTFAQNTIVHESGHAERAMQGGRELQKAVGNFAPVSDCTGLMMQLENLRLRSIESIDRINVDYDAATQHGKTQGAVYP